MRHKGELKELRMNVYDTFVRTRPSKFGKRTTLAEVLSAF